MKKMVFFILFVVSLLYPQTYSDFINRYKLNIATRFESVDFVLPDSIQIENKIACDSYYNSGTSKNDLITGRESRDVIYADKDNWNYTDIDAGSDAVFGNKGDDFIEGGRTTSVILIDGGFGNDEIYGTNTNDKNSLTGDIIIGGAGDDDIMSGSGNDIVIGGAGDDSLYNYAENGVRYSKNTYVYRGYKKDYDIYDRDGYTYVIDSISGRDGKDRIANGYREGTYSSKGDRLQFKDGFMDIVTKEFHKNIVDSRVIYKDEDINNSNNNNTDTGNIVYLSNYTSIDESASKHNIALSEAIADTPQGGILVLDLNGVFTIEDSIVIDKNINIVGSGHSFILKASKSMKIMIDIKASSVKLKDFTLDGNSIAKTGIETDRLPIAIEHCTIAHFKTTTKNSLATGITLVPRSGSEGSISIKNCQIYDIVNTVHDDRRGSNGMVRAIFIALNHIDGADITIEKNYIYDLDSEEDDFIYIEKLDNTVLSDKDYKYKTSIKNNRFIGFTRRALKLAISNTDIENNIIISSTDKDQSLYPAYGAVTLFGSGNIVKNNKITVYSDFERVISIESDGSRKLYDTIIDNNDILIYGGDIQQFALEMFYEVHDYKVSHNKFQFDTPYYYDGNGDRSSQFFYLKAFTEGKILNNIFKIKNGKIYSIVHENLYRSSKATNKTILQDNNITGDSDYYVQFQGRSDSNALSTRFSVGYSVDITYTGNKYSSEKPVIEITSIK